MTTAKQLASLIGTTEKAIRKYARKNFTKSETGNWHFTSEEVNQITTALKGKKTADLSHLTKYEQITLNWIIETGWWNGEESFSDIDATDVANGIGKTVQQTRGYLGSLVKKEYLYISEADKLNDIPPIIYNGDKLTFNETTKKYEVL